MPLYFSLTPSLAMSLQIYIIKLHVNLIGLEKNAEVIIEKFSEKYFSYIFLKAIKSKSNSQYYQKDHLFGQLSMQKKSVSGALSSDVL